MQYITLGSENPRKLIIVAHGYGANKDDLTFLAEYLRDVKDALFVFPDGPLALDSFGSKAWFPLDNMETSYLENQVLSAVPLYQDFIQSQQERTGLRPQETLLVGFSQGAMLSLAAALYTPSPLAKGVISFCGMLLVKPLETQSHVLLVHGEEDVVVPCTYSTLAHEELKRHHISAQLTLLPQEGHTISPMGLKIAQKFITGLMFPKKY